MLYSKAHAIRLDIVIKGRIKNGWDTPDVVKGYNNLAGIRSFQGVCRG